MPRVKTPRATTPPQKQVLTMPEAGTAPQIRKVVSPAGAPTVDLEAQIRQRAYELYQERGCTPGQENEDWVRAEHEILARHNQDRKQSA